MSDTSEPVNLLAEIERQQDALLRDLDDLNRRIQATLAEFTKSEPANSLDVVPTPAAA